MQVKIYVYFKTYLSTHLSIYLSIYMCVCIYIYIYIYIIYIYIYIYILLPEYILNFLWLVFCLFCWISVSVSVFWSDFIIYHSAHNTFGDLWKTWAGSFPNQVYCRYPSTCQGNEHGFFSSIIAKAYHEPAKTSGLEFIFHS